MVPESDRLIDIKNFKTWDKMIDLDLRSHDLIDVFTQKMVMLTGMKKNEIV